MKQEHKDIKVSGKEKAGIEGWHTLSTCDIRDPKAKKVEANILSFLEDSRAKAKEIQKRILQVKSQILDTGVLDHLVDEKNHLRRKLQRHNLKQHQVLQQLYRQLQDLTLVNQVTVKNIIPTAGRTVIAEWIVGDNTNDADNGANYGSLGDSNTAVANGDTTLGNETYRKATSSANNASNIAYLSNFYSATEVTGTFEEAGWHIDGTGTTDSGELLSHFLTGTITKTSVETLTVESQLTIS